MGSLVATLCMALSQVLAVASVECVTVTPTAQAEHVSAVRTRTAVSAPKEGSAVGMETAGATAASALMATTVCYAINAQTARHHVRHTGKALSPSWELGTAGLSHYHLSALSCKRHG